MALELVRSRMLTKMGDQLLGHLPEQLCLSGIFFVGILLRDPIVACH